MADEATPVKTEECSAKGWTLSGTAEWFKSWQTIAAAIVFGGTLAWNFIYPTGPEFLITGSKGPFAMPYLPEPSKTPTSERVVGENMPLMRFSEYAEYRIQNKGKKPFKALKLMFGDLGTGFINWRDQSEEDHSQTNYKPIELGDLYSGQSVKVEVWSSKPIDRSNPPILTHEEGSSPLLVREPVGWDRTITNGFMLVAMVLIYQAGTSTYAAKQEAAKAKIVTDALQKALDKMLAGIELLESLPDEKT